MDMACRLAKGLHSRSQDQGCIRKGCVRRALGKAIRGSRALRRNDGNLQLTTFLKDNYTDDADLSIIHLLCCKALGADIRLARLKRIPGLNGYDGYPPESALWLIVDGACSYLGQTFGPGLCIWKKGWHQVTEYLLPGGILSQFYDPTIKYNFIPALRGSQSPTRIRAAEGKPCLRPFKAAGNTGIRRNRTYAHSPGSDIAG